MNKIIKNLSSISLLFLIALDSHAIGLADFVPGFMSSPPTENSDSNLPIKPIVTTNRSSSSPESSWYCNRRQANQNNVFCKHSDDEVAHIRTYNSDNGDKSRVVDSSTKAAQATANQNSLQDQSTKNELDKSKNNFSLPIQPSKNVNMNVGQNQVDFNIKY